MERTTEKEDSCIFQLFREIIYIQSSDETFYLHDVSKQTCLRQSSYPFGFWEKIA